MAFIMDAKMQFIVFKNILCNHYFNENHFNMTILKKIKVPIFLIFFLSNVILIDEQDFCN